MFCEQKVFLRNIKKSLWAKFKFCNSDTLEVKCTILSCNSFIPFLLVAKHQVNPFMEMFRHILAF